MGSHEIFLKVCSMHMHVSTLLWPSIKTGLAEKMWNQMGGKCLLVLIGLKVLVMMNSLRNIVTSGAQGLLMLMGSKFLIKMTRLQNIMIKEQCFVAWSSLSKISIPSTSGGLSSWNNNVLQWVHHDQKPPYLSKPGALSAHLISHLFQQGLI